MDVEIEVQGLAELQSATLKALKDLPPGLQRAMGEATAVVTGEAKVRAPVDTGRLRASITPEVRRLGGGDVQGIVGSNVVYAPYQEFGTVYMKGRFYLRGALEAKMNEIEAILRRFMGKIVTTIVRD